MRIIFGIAVIFGVIGNILYSQNSEKTYFTNVAYEVGITPANGHQVAFVDLNGDGYPDCFFVKLMPNGIGTSVFYSSIKDGKLTFTDSTSESGINQNPLDPKGVRYGGSVVFADVDNDGDIDIFSGRYCDFLKPKVNPQTNEIIKDADGHPVPLTPDDDLRSEILLNDGKGHFTILKESGVEKNPATTCAASFFDYNNDGVLDLFVGNWYKYYGISMECYVSRLYYGVGDGKFEDVTAKAKIMTIDEPGKPDSSRPIYGVNHCDYNNDGWQDILVCAYGRQANRLWENNKDGTFRDVGAQTHFDGDEIRHGKYPSQTKEWWKKRFGQEIQDEQEWRSHGNTFSAAPGDFDNDGDTDIFLGEITHGWAGDSSDRSSLLINSGYEGKFVFKRDPDAMPRKKSGENGWNQGDINTAWFDFDNDGLLDMLISSGDYPEQYLRMFHQKEDHTFEDITDKCGFNWESSAGISLADYDRDGDIDILAGKSWARLPDEKKVGDHPMPALFRNDIGNNNNWIEITLEGKGRDGTNRKGVGAKIIVKAGGLTQMREMYEGSTGHVGLIPFEVHFGLGKAEKLSSLTIEWNNKDKSTTTFQDIPVNQIIKIAEETNKMEKWR